MQTNKNRKLKNYFINNKIQFRVIGIAFVYMFVGLLTILVTLSIPYISNFNDSNPIEVQFQAAQGYLVFINRVAPAVIGVAFLMFIQLIIVTHRICGPWVSLSRTLKQVGAGDLSARAHIRKGDLLTQECTDINEMIDALTQRISHHQENLMAVKAILINLQDRIEDPSATNEINQALSTIAESEKTLPTAHSTEGCH